jgi:biotin synthase
MGLTPTQTVLERLQAADRPDPADIRAILCLTDSREIEGVYRFADTVRKQAVGDGVLLRGIVEFSNVCRNTCAYCGLNRNNTHLSRYRLTGEEILRAVEGIHEAQIRTVVLQSGEDGHLDASWLCRIIEAIKRRFDMAVTLSVGERSREDYRLWRDAGADRYLLKIETSHADLYRSLHPHMSFENRIRCLEDLRSLGYQTGSGDLVGLPGQTVEDLGRDVEFFVEGRFDMVSVSPFIPHEKTPLAVHAPGDLAITLKMIALARIVCPWAHIPASTAIGSLNGRDCRAMALAVGANVVMPNFTPQPYRGKYEIYPGKIGRDTSPDESLTSVRRMVAAAGRRTDPGRGDALNCGFRIADGLTPMVNSRS